MVNSNYESTRVNKDHDDKKSRSSLIVKIPPRAMVKKRKLRVHVKENPSLKRSKNTSFKQPLCFTSYESDKEDSIPNEFTSINENTVEENEVAEIISLLERARSRSFGTEEDEKTIPDSSLNNNVMIAPQKKMKGKYY